MRMPETFQKGWQYYSKTAAAGLSAAAGQDYCKNIESAINIFEDEMYKIVKKHGNLGTEQCKGFVAEVWHANTFNINAALNTSPHKAFVDQSTDLGSVDISTNYGKTFSLKYLSDAKKSANAQAKNYYTNYYEYLRKPRKSKPMSFEEYLQKYDIKNKPDELLKSVYSGQYRVIPKEQLNEAIKHLEKLIKIEKKKNGQNRALVYTNYLETLKKLTDRVSDGEGVESIPLDKASAEVIVQLCKDEKFKTEDFGIDLQNMITNDYILQQALKAGYTASVMSLVMEVAPEICNAIVFLIKNGEIDEKKLKKLGFDAIKGASLGFVRGYTSCALTIACRSGKLGKQFVNIESNVIAAITVLTIDTIKDAWLVALGKMSGREMREKTEDKAIITISALIGASIGTALLPELTVLGYMVGSFVGSVVGTLIAEGKNSFIMALCANTGITLFGIVDQNYALSKEMLKSLGLHVVEPNTVNLKINKVKYNTLNRINLNTHQIHAIEISTLRRGVIGVRRIGYV